VGAGDVSGRKVTVAAQNGATVDASGTANHVVLATGGATDLLRYVTTCAGQAVTAGNTANVGAWDIEIESPT
jgi:aspartate oxidase